MIAERMLIYSSWPALRLVVRSRHRPGELARSRCRKRGGRSTSVHHPRHRERGELRRSEMKVLMTLYGDEALKQVESPQDIARTMQAWGEFGAAAQEAGVFVVCDALEGAHTSTTVRVQGGARKVTDGPFIETKEQLGGVIILDVRDLDEALQWAERTPW